MKTPASERKLALEAVVSAAVLVATSFRLRNEDDLITTLRTLVREVDILQAATPASDENPSKSGRTVTLLEGRV